MLVVVADPLQLAASRQLPGDKLQAPPQQFTVEEHEELGHHSEEEKTGGIRLIERITLMEEEAARRKGSQRIVLLFSSTRGEVPRIKVGYLYRWHRAGKWRMCVLGNAEWPIKKRGTALNSGKQDGKWFYDPVLEKIKRGLFPWILFQ